MSSTRRGAEEEEEETSEERLAHFPELKVPLAFSQN
jgi:hypothetical protein